MTGEHTDLLADAETRAFAQSRFDVPLLVEAGAGTGKTALLAARVVAWCAGDGWRRHEARGEAPRVVARRVIERVVAITFTEAAAAEMAQRVGRAFGSLARGDELQWIDMALAPFTDRDALLERCTLLADEVHRLPAMTIHSFCHRLLRAFPLEGGLHPSFEVDGDGRLLEQATVEVVEDALRRAARSGGDPGWQRLAAAGVGPREVAEALGELLARGVSSDELEADRLSPDAARECAGRISAAVRAVSEAGALAIAGAGCGPITDDLCDAILRLQAALGGPDFEPSFESLAAALDLFDDRTINRLRAWAQGEFLTKETLSLGDAADAVAAAAAELVQPVTALHPVRPAELSASRRVLTALLAELEGRLRRRGVVTYEGLLRGARRALAGWERVRREVRSGIDQLLVDEFQDTDDVQCDIVRWLALDGPTGARPGLFIVGDPKQSIYGWRRADLGAYQDFKTLLGENLGLTRPLVSNFRSVGVILDEVERVVSDVMVEEDGVQPPFEPLEPTGERVTSTGFNAGVCTPVEYWAAWRRDSDSGACDPGVAAGDAVEVEAGALAADIRRLHDEHDVPWGDVGVLLRTTTAQEEILDRFRELEIPFEVARERDYYRQREVVEAAALVRCVLEPTDQLALLTVLRSDAVGVPDAALAPLWDQGLPSLMAGLEGPPGVPEVSACIDRAAPLVGSDLPGVSSLPRWPTSLRSAVAAVASLRVLVRHAPPDTFVEALRSLWLTEVTASARYLGRFRRARLERFYDELTESLATADGGPATVTRFLRRAVEEGRESQLPAEPDLSTDAVHVMTIHGAKGLDFEHVYLVQIHRQAGGGRSRPAAEVIRWRGSLEYRLFGNPTPGWESAREDRELRGRAEWVRLLYVAMTRAKNRLVVSGRWHDHANLVPAERARSFADLVAHRADTGSMLEQAAAGRARRTEEGGLVQWVLPDAESADRVPPAAAAGTPAWLTADRAAADALRLADLRSAAAFRQALPLLATATGVAHRPLEAEVADEEPVPRAKRDAAMVVGTAVHGLLERLDLEGDLGEQLDRLGPELTDRVVGEVAEPVRAETRRRAEQLLEAIRRGGCLRRLGELGDAVVARELPLLMPPRDGDPVLGAVAGTADLVYRENGGLVVGDYKTDAVTGEEQIAERAELYRPQLELYGRAIREALRLDDAPRLEIWFLDADRIVRL